MDDSDDKIIIRKKSNTFNIHLIQKKEEILKKKTEERSTGSKNKEINKNKIDNEINNKVKIIDNDRTLSNDLDKTKEIDIISSEPDLTDNINDYKLSCYNTESSIQDIISKMGMGSLCSIILNLSINNISISSLNISQRIFYISIYIYPLFIIIIGIISNWTLNITSKIVYKYKKKTYEGIIKEALFKHLIPIYFFLLILTYFGNIILEQMIAYQLICEIIIKFYTNLKDNLFGIKLKYFIIYGFAFLILLPIFQLKNYDTFGQIVIIEIIIFTIIFLIILTNFILLFFYNFNFDSFKNKFTINKDYFLAQKNEIFNSIAVLFYSFSHHDNIFLIIEKLPNQYLKSINTIIKRTIITDILLNIIFGIIGFFALPCNMIKDLIIFRNIEIEQSFLFSDWLMNIGRIIYLIFIIFKLLKDYQKLRNIILNNIFCCYDTNKKGKIINLFISFIILLFTTFIVIIFHYISECICLIGALCSVNISFVLPLIMFINSKDFSCYHWKNVFTFLIIFLILFSSSCSLYFTIKKILSFTND